jgi:DNA-binding XRE family transcriptional regulator
MYAIWEAKFTMLHTHNTHIKTVNKPAASFQRKGVEGVLIRAIVARRPSAINGRRNIASIRTSIENDTKNLRDASKKVLSQLPKSVNKRGELQKMTELEFTSKFASAITRWRKRLDMTAAEFAAFIGISENTVYNYESARSMPQLYTAMLIAERLGVSIDEFLSGK